MDGDNIGEFKTSPTTPFWQCLIYLSIDDEYVNIGSIEVDLSYLADTPTLRTKEGPKGTYYQIDYSVIILLGEIELKAVLAWEEDVSSVFYCCYIEIPADVNPRPGWRKEVLDYYAPLHPMSSDNPFQERWADPIYWLVVVTVAIIVLKRGYCTITIDRKSVV